MKLNPFVFLYKSNDILCFYNSLTMERLYLNINDIEKETGTLYKKMFYVNDNFNERNYYSTITQCYNNDSHINSVIMLLTSECNFNCKYCFIESRFNKYIKKKMTIQTAKKTVEFLIKNMINNCMIIFYGGEPLLNVDIIKYIVSNLNKYSNDIKYTIITNGALIDDKLIEFCESYKIHICVSLDGPSEINDINRIDKKGNGTFEIVYKNLQKCKDRAIDIGLSVTITPDNALEKLLPILKDLGIKSIGFNTLSPNNNIQIKERHHREISNHILNTILKFKQEGITEEKYYSLRYKSLKKRLFVLRHCSAYGKQIVITPDGKIGPCQGLWPDYENNNGNEFFKISLDSSIDDFTHSYNKWNQRIPIFMESCYKCPAIAICGGGCAKNAYIENKDINSIDKTFCEEMKTLLAWSIWH